jgi:hypothetical protein
MVMFPHFCSRQTLKQISFHDRPVTKQPNNPNIIPKTRTENHKTQLLTNQNIPLPNQTIIPDPPQLTHESSRPMIHTGAIQQNNNNHLGVFKNTKYRIIILESV